MSRNAKKYQPFNALDGYFDSIENKNDELNNMTKPTLSEDDCIRINENLIEAINNNLLCNITIFKNKRIINIESKIHKVLNGYLYLEEDKILITDIIDLTI